MTFWLIAGALLLLGLGFVGYSAIFAARADRAGDATTTDTTIDADTAVNIRVHAEHQAELDRQLEAGEIASEQYRELLAETRRKLLAERVAATATGDQSGNWLILLFAALLPVLAGALYWQLGAAPDLVIADQLTAPDAVAARIKPRIQARLRSRPDNPYYWLVLARMEQSERNFTAAIDAYAKAVALLPEDGAVRARYAQALFLAADNRVTPAVDSQIAHALTLAPDDGIALELAGIAAFSKGDFRTALAAWQRALQQTPADSEEARALRAGIAKARESLGEPPTGRSITIRVALADTLHPDPSATVFVLVREWQGRPMPVMARRLRVADLPVEITFSDDMALTPGRDLSSVAAIELVARVSVGGTPEPAPGDLEGRLGPLTPDAGGKALDLRIDHSLPVPSR